MADSNSSIPNVQGTKKSTPVGMIVTSIILGVSSDFSYLYVFR